MKALNITLIFLIFFSCKTISNQKKIIAKENDLVLYLESSPIKNDSVTFYLKNNSSTNYYLPIENKVEEFNKWNFFNPKSIFNEKEFVIDNSNSSLSMFFEKKGKMFNIYIKNIRSYLNTFTFDKVTKIDAKQTIKFKMPYASRKNIALINWNDIMKDKDLYFNIQLNPSISEAQYLPNSTKVLLEQKGYVFYNYKINSNKVLFILGDKPLWK